LKSFNASYFMKCLNSFQKIEIVGDIAKFKDSKNVIYPFKPNYPHIRVKFNFYIKTVADVVRFLNIIWNGTQHKRIIIGLRKAEDETYVYGMPETVFVLSRIRRTINMLSSSMTELNAMNQFMDFCRTLFGMLIGGTSEKPGVLTQNMCRVILQTNCGAVFRMDIQELLQDKFPEFHNIPAEHVDDFYTTFDCLNDYVNCSLDSGKSVFYCQIEDHDERSLVYRELKQREDLNSLLEYIPVKTVKK